MSSVAAAGPSPGRAEPGHVVDAGERRLRRLAGVGGAALLAGVLLLPTGWDDELVGWFLVGALVAWLLGVPASSLLWRRPTGAVRVVARHAVAGLLLGAGVGLAFGAGFVLDPDPSALTVYGALTVVAAATGLTVATGAAAVGLLLPRAALLPVAVGGVVVTLVVVVLTWQLYAPRLWDEVVVNPTAQVQRVGGAEVLATRLADGFERQAADGAERTAHATWVVVADRAVPAALGNSELSMSYTPTEDLPRLRATGERVRLVDVRVRASATRPEQRACVVVTSGATRVEPRGCEDLHLLRRGPVPTLGP